MKQQTTKADELRHFAAIRYFNSYLSNLALIYSIHLLNPELNFATINYSLGNRFARNQNLNVEQETIDSEWVRFKDSTKNGSSISLFMEGLGLGRICNCHLI